MASNAVLVATNGNAVTWASLAGWMGTITRTGEGSLKLAAGAYGGKLINSGAGSLVIGAGNATPVSYTQLDVYKRQRQN